jgi:hypothetical protein
MLLDLRSLWEVGGPPGVGVVIIVLSSLEINATELSSMSVIASANGGALNFNLLTSGTLDVRRGV